MPTGLLGSLNSTSDLGSPDANGATTQQTITIGASIADDIYSTPPTGRAGEERTTTVHEFGHGVTGCNAAPGASCSYVDVGRIPLSTRMFIGAANWRPFINFGVIEPIPNFISRVLNGFQYEVQRDGEVFDNTFSYISYDSASDSFGTPTQDANGTTNCIVLGCPSNYTCVQSEYHFNNDPDGSPQGGYCLRNCGGSNPPCGAGLECACFGANCSTPACWPNGYKQQFLGSMGTRYVYTTDWRTGLSNVLTAISGQSSNATRDFVLGTDSYYSRMLLDPDTRFEVTRAMDSVYSGTGWTRGDDFPDRAASATPVYVRSSTATPIWWGNGTSSYPRFEDADDADVFMFRGLQGSSYQITAGLIDVSGSPVIQVWRLGGFYSLVATDWSTGNLTVGPLAASDWYAVVLWGGVGTTRWQGTIRLSAGDDISADVAEALPMVSGVSANATGSSSDLDAFQIYAQAGSSIQVSVTGVNNSIVLLFDPSGNYVAGSSVTPSTPFIHNNLSQTGHWVWKVWPSTTATFATSASLSCTGGCSTTIPPRAVRYAWGDQFAATFASSTTVHDYEAALTSGQGMSVSVTDATSGCLLEISVIPPIGQANLRPGGVATEILHWTDGAVAHELTGVSWDQGAGGYIQALTTGTYTFRVRQQSGTSCSWYRLQLAHGTTFSAPEFPAW